MPDRPHPPGRAAVLHTLGPNRRRVLSSNHPDLSRLSYPERHALYLRSYPDPFDTLAPALRAEGWVVVDIVLDDPVIDDAVPGAAFDHAALARIDDTRQWLRRFAPDLVLASEPSTGLWSPRAASFMGRADVASRNGVLTLGPESSDTPVSLARYAAFGRARVVCLKPGASEAAGRAAAATGAVVIGPALLGAPWPTYAHEQEAVSLVQWACRDDARARAWVASTRDRLNDERRAAVAALVASLQAPSALCRGVA